MAIFQQWKPKAEAYTMTVKKTLIERSVKLRKIPDQSALYKPIFCPEPKRENTSYPSYTADTDVLEAFHKHDIVWSLMKSQLDLSVNVPTWAAYNSLLNSKEYTTTYSSLPVINGSPTDWSNLYTALKIVQGINLVCTPHKKLLYLWIYNSMQNAYSCSQGKKSVTILFSD